MPEDRDYQRRAVADLRGAVARLPASGPRRVLLQAETGSGKTHICCLLVQAADAKGRPALIVARGRELVRQWSRELESLGVGHGVLMAGEGRSPEWPVQVASKDTLLSWAVRGGRMDLPPAALLIPDEAHESLAPQYRALIEAYPGAVVIGPTATPVGADGRSLGGFWQDMVVVEKGSRLIDRGYLVPSKVYAPVTHSMKGVHTKGGDYDPEEVGKKLHKPKLIGDVVRHWLDYGGDRPTVVYCPTCDVSRDVARRFSEAGVNAVHLDGETDPGVRDRTLDLFRAGMVKVIANVGVMVQGVDVPSISCVVWYTATKSLRKWRQGNGRGKRPWPGKEDLTVIDHAGNCFRLGMPDLDIEWTLDAGRKIEDVQKEKRKSGEAPEPLLCPQCYALFAPAPACPNCGHSMAGVKRSRAAEVACGKLQLVTGAALPADDGWEERVRRWKGMLAQCWHRNATYSIALKMYRDHYGVWPDRAFPFCSDVHGEMTKRKVRDLFPNFMDRKPKVAS